MKSVGVVVFPGSNCDEDAIQAFKRIFDAKVEKLWHEESIPKTVGLVVLPGGFSYGDYLRGGAIAKLSKAVLDLPQHLARGGKVLGICNGFQILTEAGLLPGALIKNRSSSFQCEECFVRVEQPHAPFFNRAQEHQVLKLPIAHSMGRYFISEVERKKLEAKGQIALRYCGPRGEISDKYNINGSEDSIAGVTSEDRAILGLMPHPERACEAILGSEDGRVILGSLMDVLH